MKKLISILVLTFMLLIPINIFGENNRVIDNANRLTEDEEKLLTNELNSLSDKYDMDIVVYLSVDKSFGDDIVSEGCEFYDNNGYGYGDDHRGLLLIVNYEEGIFDVITTGQQVRDKYDSYIESCYNAMQNSLGNNDFNAIRIFEDWVDTRFISYNDEQKEDFVIKKPNNIARDLTVSGIVSAIFTAITGLFLKRQLKSEGKKAGASNYIDKNSFHLTRAGDVFLYRTTSRRRIKTRSNNNNFSSSGGGGSHISHTSSSGISHGSGGGRHF